MIGDQQNQIYLIELQAFVLVPYPQGEDPGEVVRRYLGSREFAEETRTGIDPTSLLFNPPFLCLQ